VRPQFGTSQSGLGEVDLGTQRSTWYFESWRLASVGANPANEDNLVNGEKHREDYALLETLSHGHPSGAKMPIRPIAKRPQNVRSSNAGVNRSAWHRSQ